MILLLRMVPLMAGLANGGLFFLQIRNSGIYPWLSLPAVAVYLAAVIAVNWRHWNGAEHIRTLIPGFVAILISGFGLLLTEGMISNWLIPLFVGAVTYGILELQFLHAYVPARYPANGITHLNLFLVPCLFWMASFTVVGMTIFVSTSRLAPIVVMGVTGFILFYATSHAESTPPQRWRWTWIGAWIGILIGVLGVVLPLNLLIHGAIAALCSGAVLRARRYGIQPPIPGRMILMEVFAILGALAAILATARWL